MIETSKTVRLFRRQDQYGFGFSIRNSPAGPHHVGSVEEGSPASFSALKVGDLLLRINGISLIDRSYSNAIEIIKRECIDHIEIELVVVEPQLCPPNILNRSSSQSDLLDANANLPGIYSNNFSILIHFNFSFRFLFHEKKRCTIFEKLLRFAQALQS